jgi:hypothetical protein
MKNLTASNLRSAEFVEETLNSDLTEECKPFINENCISHEKLIDELENANNPAKDIDNTFNHEEDDEEMLKRRLKEKEVPLSEVDDRDIPASGPYRPLDLDESKAKKKLTIVIDEVKAASGFQNISNAGRFWRASQIMGTRKAEKHQKRDEPQKGSC